MRVAVTGTTGRVGAALASCFAAEHEVIPLPRSECDLADQSSLARALDRLECDVFLNPAGVTSLEACEDHPDLATRVNTRAPAEIALWAERRNVRFIHFSTDYVFSGEIPGLRKEEDSPAPLNQYGRSKLAGEQAVLSFPGNCVIRVSWVFGPEKPSFIDKVFDDALAGIPLAACDDKFSLPVHTRDLAGWTDALVRQNASGIVHACHSGEPASWHDMAEEVVREMQACGEFLSAPEIRRLKLAEMTAFRATRPRFTAMDTSRLTGVLGQPPRSWRDAVSGYIRARCIARGGE